MSNCTSFVIVSDGDNFSMVDNNETFSMIGGSSGGTLDYSKLRNKPSINGVELVGNKTASDLGLDVDVRFSGTTLVITTTQIGGG